MAGLLRKSFGAVLLAALALCIYLSQKHLDSRRRIDFIDRSAVFLPRGNVLKALSMGYRGIVADWLWIQSVIYFGRRVMDEENPYYLYALYGGNKEKIQAARNHHEAYHRHGEAYSAGLHGHAYDREHLQREEAFLSSLERPDSAMALPVPPDSVFLLDENLRRSLYQFNNRGLIDGVYPLLDRVTTVDPHFVHPYIFGGVYAMFETGRLRESLDLLEKGRRQNPDRWEFPFYLGWLYWMYKGEMQKTHDYLIEAVQKKGCPAYVTSLMAGLSKNMKRSDFTRLYLEGLLESSTDPQLIESIQNALDQLKAFDSADSSSKGS
jgi:tetratricopeptide (TPR) repeat protein